MGPTGGLLLGSRLSRFGLSGAEGDFSIEGVPAGTYGLEAWHEHYGRLKRWDVTVPDGGQVEVLATFVPKR